MMSYEDACGDMNLYLVWLTETFEPSELAEQVGAIIRGGGYTVMTGFETGLARISAIDLADFKAANFPFEADDRQWLRHCAALYPSSTHPTETAVELNGARATWRDRA